MRVCEAQNPRVEKVGLIVMSSVVDTSLDNMSPETAAFYSMSTDRALKRIKDRGVEIQGVIDVGASNGMWSAVCEKHYPTARYLLVEAQMIHQADLKRYCGRRRNAEFTISAAGDAVTTVYFDDSSPFGGVVSKERTDCARTEVRQTTLDAEVKARALSGPYLVKLDTHGYEIPILQGAREEVLPNAGLLVIETYNFKILPNSLRFDEMVAYMRQLGFGVIDLSEPLWRERDRSLWQFDLFFVPLTRPEFLVNTYL
jgi:FkbM family methyltransferase